MANFDYFSRFSNTPLMLYQGQPTVGTWVRPSWLRQRPPENLIGHYRVESGYIGRPDLISHAIYGTTELDWAVIAFNRPQAIFGWPKYGTVIEYPDISLIKLEL